MLWDEEFTDFVRAHTPGLYRSAWLLVGETAGAADLVQETFTALYPKWPKVQAADSPIAYVRRTLVNRFVSSARRRAGSEVVVPQVPDRGEWADPAGQTDDRVVLARRLAALRPKQRAALVARYYLDLSDQDGAAVMCCRVATFRSHVHRGLAALRAEMADEDGFTRSGSTS